MNIPNGFKLVPVEPTEEMLDVIRAGGYSWHLYSNLLAAVQTPPQPIYDEAKERELFTEFSRRIVARDAADFPIRWCDCVPDEEIEDHLNTWLACAQYRAKSVEVGDE